VPCALSSPHSERGRYPASDVVTHLVAMSVISPAPLNKYANPDAVWEH
jgi:hypothetical protein